MKIDPAAATSCRRMKQYSRFALFMLLLVILAVPLFTASTASLSNRSAAKHDRDNVNPAKNHTVEVSGYGPAGPIFEPVPLLPQAGIETVAIFESDCTTPATSFTLSQTLCAKLTNAPLGLRTTQVLRRLSISGPNGYIRSELNVAATTSTASLTFTIPSNATSLVGGETVDNRGSWQALSISMRDGSPVAKAGFTVVDSDANVKVADLALQSAATTPGELSPGENVVFTLYAENLGPDPAGQVVITDTTPNNTTFVSATVAAAEPTATPNPNFACTNDTGIVTCEGVNDTDASLAKGEKVRFDLTFKVDAGTPVRTVITNVASIATSTTLRSTRDTLTTASVVITEAAGAGTCTLSCPADVIATANTTVSTQFGAFVKFGAATAVGDCGAVTNSPGSGSFFAVGTHTVTSSAANGGSCTFNVKVLGTPAPTISCPANKTVTAGANSDEATVSVGTPTFTTANSGTVVGVRSDSTPPTVDDDGNLVSPGVPKALTDPYPIGSTGIVWTVTDEDGRTASCTQTITVNPNSCGGDTQAPTITAPPDITLGTGAGNTGCSIALDDELGQVETSDNNEATCPVVVTVTGAPAGNEFSAGTYTLTYTATDGAGNTATDTQIVTVIDNTLPIIKAPADATYTCLSEVPAANPSQATRGDVFDEDGNLLPPGPPFDNCGIPIVTVTETSTGVGSATSPKIITRTFKATDGAGNFSTAVQTITVADGIAPTLNVPADITTFLPLTSTATSMAVSFAATASDNCGTVNISYSPAPGSIFPVGTTTVTVTATDAVGNQTTGQFTVTVLYNFAGFFAPVDNLPVLNVVNAGKGVPVKFSLSGDKGLSIFAAGSPYSMTINCDGSLPQSDIEETVNAGSSSLSYSSTLDQYNYVWKTENSWAGTCRQLVVKLNDGSEHRASFNFK
jgi:uncharacterized repeat protein (TIGR01451 family)